MIVWRWITFAVVVCCAMPVWSAVRVKSGEHDSFTRLVIYFEPNQEWDLEKTEQGYRLRAAGLEDGFDLSDVYTLIPRDRIASVAGSQEVLALEFGCDCTISSKVLPTGQLVLDVSEALETSTDPTTDAPTGDEPEFQAPMDLSNFSDQQVQIELPTATRAATIELDVDEESPVEIEELTIFRRNLLENLGRSASLSLVNLAEDGEQSAVTLQADENAGTTGAEQIDRTRVSNAVDEALKRAVSLGDPIVQRSCPDPSVFDIADWGDDNGFVEQISTIRRSLIQEFDRVDQSQVISLAKAYLHYGLVEEGKYVLSQFEPHGKEKDALLVLANVMGDTNAVPSADLTSFDHCGGPIIPWLVLNAPRTTTMSEQRRQGLVAEFARWPKSLQGLLGPRLLSALKTRGHETTASVLSAYISGIGSPNKADEAVEKLPLSDVLSRVDGGSETSTAALATYLRRAMDEGAEIDPKLLELSAAFERETGNSPISGELFALRLEALAYRGDVAMVLDEIQELPNNVDGVSNETLQRISEHVLSASASDPVFRFSMFLEGKSALGRLPSDTVERLAQRHAKMGLPGVASRMLDNLGQADRPVDVQIDVAEADGRVEDAVALLSKSNSTDSLRRQAALLLKHRRADQLTSAQRAELPEELQDRVAWATSDWANVRGEGKIGAASELIVDLQNADLDETPLTNAKDIKTKSAASRDLLAELLARPAE